MYCIYVVGDHRIKNNKLKTILENLLNACEDLKYRQRMKD